MKIKPACRLFVLFLICSCVSAASLGQHPLQSGKNISTEKIILQLRSDISPANAVDFFEQRLPWLDFSKSIRLEFPSVIIARLKKPAEDYTRLKQLLTEAESHQEVLFANPVLQKDGEEAAVLHEVFVKTENADDEKMLKQLAAAVPFEIISAYSFNKKIFILSPVKNSGMNSLELSELLSGKKIFGFVHPNLLFNPVVTTNDPFFNRQWNIKNTGASLQGSGTPGADMKVEEAWEITRGDTSIKIAILDSGVDTLHPDLMPNLLPGYDAIGGGSRGYPNANFSKDAHGTACAGIVAAVADNGLGLAGVAPGCRIVPVKIFYYVDTAIGLTFSPPIPYTTSLWLADGINWTYQVADADIMSNSWAVPDVLFGLLQQPVSLVEDAINSAHESGRNGLGVPQLYSTGNDNAAAPLWPSRLWQTIAVTATSMCDERKSATSCDNETSWGGNYGSGTDIAAPGVKIPATDMLGNKGFSAGHYMADFNGTSAACPNAAGVMALILSVKPGLKTFDARYILANSADKVGGYNYDSVKYAGTWSRELGFGRVNALKALQMTLDYTDVKSPGEQISFSVYPNPSASEKIYVVFSLKESGMARLTLTDLNGKIISEKTMTLAKGEQSVTMDSPALPGVYFVRLAMNESAHTKKLLFLGN